MPNHRTRSSRLLYGCDRSCVLLATAMLGACLACPQTQAETKIGFRQLTTTHPVAVQRGVDSEVKLRSNFTLNNTHSVLFAREGVTMNCLESKPIEAPRKGRGSKGTPFRFEVKTPKDQTPGIYEFRVATDQAVSSCGQIMVTEYPVVLESEGDNQSAEKAQQVQFPVAICGVCEKFEDVDCFQFEGKAGQELTFQIFAQRVTDKIHSMVVRGPRIYLMDPILTLTGPQGQVIAQNDNFYGGDSLIASKLPLNGVYTLQVRDARFAGDQRYSYCVEIADAPFAYHAYPMAVQRGTTADVQIVGHALGEMPAVQITTAADAELGWAKRSFQSPRGGTSFTPVCVSQHPQHLEREENNSVEQSESIHIPSGVNGRLNAAEDIDFFKFTAGKGDAFRFSVEAREYGSPVDSVLELYDSKGKLLVEADDRAAPKSKDSELLWKATADGEYCIAIRDLHDRGGERFVYHLQAERAAPDFVLTGEYYYAMLAPGTRMIWFAKVNRLNGFDGPVKIEVEGLPKGVTQTPVTIPQGIDQCSIILSASQDAKISASLVQVLGRATITQDGKESNIVRRGHVTCEQQSSGGGQARWPIQTQIVGVTKPLDLVEVTASPSEIVLAPGETAEIKVGIKRTEGFKDAVSLDMEFKYFTTVLGRQLPPGVTMSSKSKARLTGDNLVGLIVLEASDKAKPVKKFPVAVVARVSITFSITTNYASAPILLSITEKK